MKIVLKIALIAGLLFAVTSCRDTKQEEAEAEVVVEQVEAIEKEVEQVSQEIENEAIELENELKEIDNL